MAPIRIKRFGKVDRLFHVFLMLTFLIQSATGFSRLFYTTSWGKKLNMVFGGYEMSLFIHYWVGIAMTVGFLIHVIYLLMKIEPANLKNSIFGPDSLVPNWQDFRNVGKRIGWFFGFGSSPRFDRWTYWEKFDYWAVFWGLPLLSVTGIILTYPIAASRLFPGWVLNITALLHRAEALLAVSYIFIVHFFIGHLRPTSFPMNEAMFSGSVPLEEAREEKPAWVERLKEEDRIETAKVPSPKTWYRVTYYVFGYAALGFGVYLLINGIIYSPYIRLH